jgi:hypothetical protein
LEWAQESDRGTSLFASIKTETKTLWGKKKQGSASLSRASLNISEK